MERKKKGKKTNINSLKNNSCSYSLANASIELTSHTSYLDCVRASFHIYKNMERNVDILVHAYLPHQIQPRKLKFNNGAKRLRSIKQQKVNAVTTHKAGSSLQRYSSTEELYIISTLTNIPIELKVKYFFSGALIHGGLCCINNNLTQNLVFLYGRENVKKFTMRAVITKHKHSALGSTGIF